MNKFKKILALLVCLVIFTTCLSSLSFALKVNDIFERDLNDLDYDSLLHSAYIINGSWTASDLASGKYLTFSFRGERITEKYNSARHFLSFDSAYNYYLSQNPDILTDLPVFIFAPGTYNSLITVRYSAVILGANAGINPNAQHAWSLEGVENGVAINSERTEETVFTKGITRTTRTDQKDAKWAYELETAEIAAGKKAEIKLIVDGVKITGSVGISQYDYSKRDYTSSDGLTLNGQPFNYTFDGTRTTLTALTHSVVDNFSGSGASALFSARCDSKNKNDAVLLNVRMTNISSSAKFLFNKYFRNLTIDGLYYAHNQTALFGSNTTGSSFCGNSSAKTAEYNQNVEIKNSVFYKNGVTHTISLGNANVGSGYTELYADIYDNIFYDAVCFENGGDYWGVFLVHSAKSGVDYTVNIFDNIIHQQTTLLHTLFNGNGGYQKSNTYLNFNRNKVTGFVDSIYPNTNWNSSHYNVISNSLYYDFSDNFVAPSPNDTGKRPSWTYPPAVNLASGYDYRSATYYLDYDLTMNSSDFDIRSVTGLGSKVQINGCDVTADCKGMTGIVTPSINVKTGVSASLYKDEDCTQPIESVDISKIEKGVCYYIKISNGEKSVVGLLTITTDKYSDINSVSEIDESKFKLPIISINTEGGAPVVDKDNYVNCGVTISNTDAEYCMQDTVAGIRYRGNSTLSAADKKPYRIKFDKKQDLFGMGKAKSWVLLANAFDKTMVRNAIAFAIGGALDLEYTSEYQFVNFYLNGKYQGMYLLCEQTQTGKTRVDVEEDETGKIDTGYLVEISGNGDTSEDKFFRIDEVPTGELANSSIHNWRVTNSFFAYVKTPEYEFCSSEQVNFISNYVNDVNHAILTQDWDAFNALCDVESFAKYFITNTVLNNGDGGYQVYMYKKENGGKLYAGPIWDFDQSAAGTIQCGDSYDKWYTGSTYPWFDSFSTWPEFLRLAKGIYLENHDEIEDIIDYYTKEFYPENAYDFHANDVRWDSVERDYWRITETIKKLKNYPANFAHLAQWFSNRIYWLDSRYDAVIVPPTRVSLETNSIALEAGESYTINFSYLPTYADLSTVNWTSTASSVVTVENGVVTAHKDGTAVIVMAVTDTGIFERINVTVCSNHINRADYNDTQHYNVCTLCHKETGFENHNFVNACDTDCECGFTRVTSHDYKSTYDTENHFDKCTVCGDVVNSKPHVFVNACDTDCACGYIREITHNHKPTFDAENHFEKCTVCGDVINSKPHVFENACDTDCACGYTRAITHDHKPAYDDDNHFEKCTVCGDVINLKPHSFTHVCDTTCDCGYTRTVPHDYKPTFNGSHHFEKCSLCDDIINSQPHKYDGHSDTICDCGYERASLHDYQPSFDDNNHYKECTICFDKIEVTPHVFENACDTDCACGYIRVVEPHVYDNDCDKFCNVCQAERPVEPHKYDNACDKFCNECNAERPVEPHVYDNACDKFCNICNAERPVEPHVYDNACDKFCNICNAERTVEPHVYDNACDKFCNICNAERTVEPHKYDNACDKDCNVCKATRTVEPHKYDNACDNDCNVCKAVRTVPAHVYDNACDKDCNVCKAVRTVEPHKYDNAFDAFCNICKAERTPPNTATRSFVDVPANAWYKYYVDYAVAYGLFSGTSDTTFSPNADMTRAQFVQVLANLSGAKLDNSKASGFSDAPAGKWFTGAVKWAVDNGIASGIGGGKFNPTGKIDRQQMCMMLVNYVENYKKTTLKEKVAYKTFADDKEIAGWAKTAVIKCFKAGLVSGTGNNKFSPKVVANRATGATIFTNFHKEYIA